MTILWKQRQLIIGLNSSRTRSLIPTWSINHNDVFRTFHQQYRKKMNGCDDSLKDMIHCQIDGISKHLVFHFIGGFRHVSSFNLQMLWGTGLCRGVPSAEWISRNMSIFRLPSTSRLSLNAPLVIKENSGKGFTLKWPLPHTGSCVYQHFPLNEDLEWPLSFRKWLFKF